MQSAFASKLGMVIFTCTYVSMNLVLIAPVYIDVEFCMSVKKFDMCSVQEHVRKFEYCMFAKSPLCSCFDVLQQQLSLVV